MSSLRSLRLAVALLFAGGVVFVVVGWRVLDLESAERTRRDARDARVAVARGKADAELLARTPRGKPLASWRLEQATWRGGDDASSAAAGHWARLQDAAALETDPTRALERYDALLHPELPTWVQDIAALRSAVLLNGLRRFEASRRRLGRAAQASPLLDGLERRRVRSTALRYLALEAASRDDPGPLRRLLDESEDGGRLVAGDVVGPGRNVIRLADALERTSWWQPEDPDVRRLIAARERAMEGLRVLGAMPEPGIRLLEDRLAWRRGGQLAVFPIAALMQPALPRTERGYDLVVLEPGVALPPRAEPLAPPLARVAVVPRPTDGDDDPGGWLGLALGIGLLAYAIGAAAAVVGWRRSVRAARQQAHFTAAVSHEMKTPIAATRAMAELLATAPDGEAAKTRTYGERIDREMQRLAATVANVLDASQIERGTFQVQATPGDPEALLRRVVEAWRPAAAKRGFEITLATEPPTGPVWIDAAALEGVLRNLLDNAVKFSGDVRRLDVAGAPRPGGGYLMRVMDRGVGLGSGNPERLFRRYNRGASAREGAVPGVGLGLHIARAVVGAHGGRLRARPRPRGGAVFEIELPGGHEA